MNIMKINKIMKNTEMYLKLFKRTIKNTPYSTSYSEPKLN